MLQLRENLIGNNVCQIFYLYFCEIFWKIFHKELKSKFHYNLIINAGSINY